MLFEFFTMTEDSIEREAERQMDRLDARFLAGEIPEDVYNMGVDGIREYVRDSLAEIRRVRS